MRVLLVHNRYQQRGGEDVVFDAELALLRERGHEVEALVVDNAEIAERRSLPQSIALGLNTVWSREGHQRVQRAVQGFRPQVVHFHNTFHLISPSGYYAAKSEGARVVQTLHNFRLLCASAILHREGKVCEDCVGRRVALPALRHRCFRGSRSATAALVAMQAAHRAAGTWIRQVDAFIALTDFACAKFLKAGLPARKLVVKPNFLPNDPGRGDARVGNALFVGRLSPEKGIRTLMEAWRLGGELPKLTIIGDGPLAGEVRSFTQRHPGVEWVGWRSSEEVLTAMKSAGVLVMPSRWFEGFPRVLVEAYAVGLPVIASDLGSLAELVDEGETGLKFRPDEPQALVEVLRRLEADSPLRRRLADGARRAFETHYTAERHLERVLEIYRGAAVGQAVAR